MTLDACSGAESQRGITWLDSGGLLEKHCANLSRPGEEGVAAPIAHLTRKESGAISL